MSDWILLRHGESVGNRERWLAGNTNTPLTERGRHQARMAGRQLLDTPLARVLSSSLSRARDTAELLLAGRDVPLSFHDDLQERILGTWATRHIDEVRAEVGNDLWSWDVPAPEGESGRQVAARSLAFLRDVPPVPGTTLLVCHGGVIRSLLGLARDTPYQHIGRLKIANATPIPVDLGPGGWLGVWVRHAAELERIRT